MRSRSRRSRLRLLLLVSLLALAVVVQGAVSLAGAAPVPAASAHALVAPNPCGVVSYSQGAMIAAGSAKNNLVTSLPMVFYFLAYNFGGDWMGGLDYQIRDQTGVLVAADTITPSGGMGAYCEASVTVSAFAGWQPGVLYTVCMKQFDENHVYRPSECATFSVNATAPLPTATPSPPVSTPTPTAPACSSSGNDPIFLWPTGVQNSTTPAISFTYNSIAGRNMASFDWWVLNAYGNSIYEHGPQSATVGPGCRVNMSVPAALMLQPGTLYGIQAQTTDTSSVKSLAVISWFYVSAVATPNVFNPGGGGTLDTNTTVISYACGTPPMLLNEDNKGGFGAAVLWVFCQAKHLDLLSPFEGIIDPLVGYILGWFRNWNNFFGPAWTDLNNISGSINTLWNNLTGIKTGIIGAINNTVGNILSVPNTITAWLTPHPTDFIPLQFVLEDINSREPFHFMVTLANTYIGISNQFWSASGLVSADLPNVSSQLGCNALPNDVAGASPTATVAAAPTPTDIPTVAVQQTPLVWPTPNWYKAPGILDPVTGHAGVVLSLTPYAGWNGSLCPAVAQGQIPSDTGASSGGSLPSVPNVVPNAGGANAYVVNPLTGSASSSSSYGALSGGVAMYLTLLSNMGISRDNFAKIIDLFVIVAALVVIGRDLGVRAGNYAAGSTKD